MSQASPSTTPGPPPAPPGLLAHPDARDLMLWLAGLAVVLGVARASGAGSTSGWLAALLLVGSPFVARQLEGRPGQIFLLAAAAGAWFVFRPFQYTGGREALAALVVSRLAYFAIPPLVLALLLRQEERDRLSLTPLHLYAPAGVMGAGSLLHLWLRWSVPSREAELQRGVLFYALIYVSLIVVAMMIRLTAHAPDPRPKLSADNSGIGMEETGRFGMAARLYEREGALDKAALAAERAGDWSRAGRLYRRTGDDFNAGEMFYRAQMWQEALAAYEAAGTLPAAARLCVQLGQVDRALALYERAGDHAAVVRVAEEAGRRPSAEQYRRAGLLEKAAGVFEEQGDWQRAAQIYEHEMRDLQRAARLHRKQRSFVYAARLFEQLGSKQEALDAYAATPTGAVDAARMHLAAGRSAEAGAALARLPASQIDTIEDPETLTLVARVLLDSNRGDEAVRVLQTLKRRGAATGAVRLLLGRALMAKGLNDLAEEELTAATGMALDPADELKAQYLLGCALEAGGKTDQALRAFHEVLQKDLQYADAQARYRGLKDSAAAPAPTD